jgi:hypothetical protein
MKVLLRIILELAFVWADIVCTTTAKANNIATTAVEWGGCDSSCLLTNQKRADLMPSQHVLL